MQTCKICRLDAAKLAEINGGLIKAEPYRVLALRCGTSTGALQRHKRHLPVNLVLANEGANLQAGETLLSLTRHLHDRAMGILARAERSGQLPVALMAIRECRALLEFLAKLDGQLKERGEDRPASITVVYSERTMIGAPTEPRMINGPDETQRDRSIKGVEIGP